MRCTVIYGARSVSTGTDSWAAEKTHLAGIRRPGAEWSPVHPDRLRLLLGVNRGLGCEWPRKIHFFFFNRFGISTAFSSRWKPFLRNSNGLKQKSWKRTSCSDIFCAGISRPLKRASGVISIDFNTIFSLGLIPGLIVLRRWVELRKCNCTLAGSLGGRGKHWLGGTPGAAKCFSLFVQRHDTIPVWGSAPGQRSTKGSHIWGATCNVTGCNGNFHISFSRYAKTKLLLCWTLQTEG